MIKIVLSGEPTPPGEATPEYVLSPDSLLLLIQDGTARLLDLTGDFYFLSPSAATMLYETLQRGQAAATIQIADTYRTEPEQIKRDLKLFLEDLESKHLIYRSDSFRQASHQTLALPLSIVIPILRCADATGLSIRKKAWVLSTLAYFSFRLFGWPRTVAVWRHYYHRYSVKVSSPAMEQAARSIDQTVRAMTATHVLNISCKERALCCWALLRSAGLPVQLVLGVDLFPFASHCWCRLNRLILSDSEDRCERFTPVLSYE